MRKTCLVLYFIHGPPVFSILVADRRLPVPVVAREVGHAGAVVLGQEPPVVAHQRVVMLARHAVVAAVLAEPQADRRERALVGRRTVLGC